MKVPITKKSCLSPNNGLENAFLSKFLGSSWADMQAASQQHVTGIYGAISLKQRHWAALAFLARDARSTARAIKPSV